MLTKLASLASLSVVALGLALAASPARAQDSLHASFERMLSPSPAAAPSAPQAAREADPLVAALLLPLRDGVWPERRIDPVAESFARMFSHQPHRAAPPVPERFEADPLIAAVVQPLLRTQQYSMVAVTAVQPPL